MVSAYYLKIDGVKGESTDKGHKDEIEIQSWSHGVSQPTSASASTSGGLATGRCSHSDLSVMKTVDVATPTLAQLCCTGKHIKEVTLVCERADGDKRVPYYTIKLTDVIISSAQVSGGGEVPMESISFNYAKINWEYAKQNVAGGSAAGKSTGSWDLKLNAVS
jgi:type VI secretion system secreted protein Hcp